MPNAIILPVDKLDRVLRGQATTNDKNSFSFVKNLLTKLTQLPKCTVSSSDNLCDQKTGDSSVRKNYIIKEKLIADNKLKNIFDYISAVIDGSQENMTSEIEKLLKLCSIFLKIDLSRSQLTLEQKNALNAAYIGLFTRIANFPEILKIDNGHENELNKNYMIVDLLNLTNHFLETWAKLNNNTEYSIFESLKDYTESVGNLTRIARNEEHNILPIEVQMNNLMNLFKPYLNLDQKKILMFTFAHEYKSGEELSTCKEVFNTTDCDPYRVTKEFKKISSGTKSFDSQISIDKDLDIGLRLLKKLKFDSASFKTMEANTKSLNNFSQYFKVLIKKFNDSGKPLPDDFTKCLFEFLSYQFKVFKGTDTLLMSYRSSFSLFLALLKNPSAKNNPLISRTLEDAFNPMEILLKSVFENSSKNKTLGILSTLEIFADMVHLAVNDVTSITLEEKKSINLEISKLIKLCFKIDECPTSSALDQFFNSLGSMVRNLSKKTKGDQEKRQAEDILQTTQQLIDNAKNDSISLSRIRNFAYAYLHGRYDQKVDAINRDCRVLFNLEECQPARPVNRTVENHTDFIIYKTTPAIPQVNTTLVSAINQTSTPDLIDNKTTIALPENVNHTFSNQTIDQTTPSNNSDAHISNPGLALGASAAHGVVSGMFNGIIQYFATKYSRHGEQSSRAKALVIYSSLLAHAVLAATFPMMLFKIQEHINQGNEDEAQQLWDNLLLQALPTFISSASSSLSLQALIELSHCLTKRFHIQAITRNTIPVLGTAYNLLFKPVETGVQLGASMATSSLTYFGLNQLSPIKNRHPSDIEKTANKYYVEYHANANECAFEIQPLNEEKEANSSNIINGIPQDLKPAEIFFEKVQFTTSKQFDNLKHYLEEIIEKVVALKDKLIDQEHSNRLEKILDIPEYKIGLRHDLKDLKDFPEKFGTEYKNCIDEEQKSAILRKNLDYFKTMIKTIHDKLLSDNVNDDCLNYILCSIETKTLKEDITKSIKFIKENLGFIRTITKPIISIHLSKETVETDQKNATALARKHSKGVNLVNNRYTFHANSDDSDPRFSSGSEEGSILSVSSSRDGEDVQIKRLLIKSS